MFGEEKCVEIIQNTDKVAYWSFLLSLMYRLKSVATPSLKPPERSKKKNKERKKKRKTKKNRTKKSFLSTYFVPWSTSVRACVLSGAPHRGAARRYPSTRALPPLTSLSSNWCMQNFTICQSRVFLAYIFVEQTLSRLG